MKKSYIYLLIAEQNAANDPFVGFVDITLSEIHPI